MTFASFFPEGGWSPTHGKVSLILILYTFSFHSQSYTCHLEHKLENFGGTAKRWNSVWFVHQMKSVLNTCLRLAEVRRREAGTSHLFGFCIPARKEKKKKNRGWSCTPAELAPHLLHRAAEPVHYNSSHQTCFARFVPHTSSLVSLSRGSRQVGHRFKDTAFWLSVRTSSPPYTFFISFTTLFLNFGGSSSRLPFCLPSELFSVLHQFFSLSFVSISLPVSTPLSVARGSWLPCWCRCLMLWGPRAHRSWKSPFPPAVQPVGDEQSGLRR